MGKASRLRQERKELRAMGIDPFKNKKNATANTETGYDTVATWEDYCETMQKLKEHGFVMKECSRSSMFGLTAFFVKEDQAQRESLEETG